MLSGVYPAADHWYEGREHAAALTTASRPMEYFARRRARSSTSFPETQATKLERSITLDAHLMQYSKGSEGIAINNFWQALPPAAV